MTTRLEELGYGLTEEQKDKIHKRIAKRYNLNIGDLREKLELNLKGNYQIITEYEKISLEDLFLKASKKNKFFLTEENKKDNGIIRFKRKTIGFIGDRTIKTKEQLAKILYKTKIVNSIKEGIELIPLLVERKRVELSETEWMGASYWDGINFFELSRENDKRYLIEVYHYYND